MPHSRSGTEGIITETASAKLNLYLHVTALRPDGYHELDSLFAFTALGDVLTFEAADHVSLRVIGAFGAGLADEADNLVLRAARALHRQGGCKPGHGARITLEKTLPIASGIGGGSADAAATLRGLNRLWEVHLDDATLTALGADLGADVPACLLSKPVQVGGIGDVLNPATALPACWVVLVNPGVPVSTPAVFRRFDAAPVFSAAAPLSSVVSFDDLVMALAARRNDLQAPGCIEAPVIHDVMAAMAAEKGCCLSRMSGSGATCFGLFAAEQDAETAADRIERAHPDWWVASTPLRMA